MRVVVCLSGLLAAIVILAPTDADAKKRSKSKKSTQVFGFVQTSGGKANGGLLQSYDRGRQHNRVAGHDHVARFFFAQTNRGAGG